MKILCPACNGLMVAHTNGVCPAEAFDAIVDALDEGHELDAEEVAPFFIEMLTLLVESENEVSDAYTECIEELSSVDLAVLLTTSARIVVGFLGAMARAHGVTLEEEIQRIALTLATNV